MAVIGAGISGLGAALALSEHHQVTLFETEERAGGHAKTAMIDYDGTPLAVDVGFMVYAPAIYPELTRLFSKLRVKSRSTTMSFGVTDNDGFAWAWSGKRDPNSWIRNGSSSTKRRLVSDILRFNGIGRHVGRDDPTCSTPLLSFLGQNGFNERFARRYALPLVCAIWSMPLSAAAAFPIGPLASFMTRHRLLHIHSHRWRSLVGGSRTYVDRILPALDDVRLSSPVHRVSRRVGGGATVREASGRQHHVDAVVFATDPQTTLTMLADADRDERDVLGQFRFRASDIFLHRDTSLMPRAASHLAAWNVRYGPRPDRSNDVSISYSLNRLQGVPRRMPLFVTVNPLQLPRKALRFGSYRLGHFHFDAASAAAQSKLPSLQGRGGIWHCGAWTRFGFHEDGLTSGLAVAADVTARLGVPALTPVS